MGNGVSLSRKQILAALLKYLSDLELVYLFGSFADNTTTAQSDIDIAVMLTKTLSSVERYNVAQLIANELNINIDLINLLDCSTVLQKQIIEKGILLFGDNACADVFEMKVMSMYQHLNDERADILKSSGF